MRPAIWKITFREIKRTLGRYLTILAIVALGIGFFVGLKITRSVMIASVSEYAEEQNFYDYEMLSTLGFTEEDVEAFSELSDVRKAAGVINLDVLYVSGEDELAISIYSISDGVNDSYLVAGRMPEAANECVVDSRLMSEEDIGTTIEIAENNDEDTLDMLVYGSYEVVGIIENPLYLNFERGTTSLGSGKISGYVFIPEEGFDSDYYTAIYIKYDQDYEFYSDEYEDYIEAHEDEADALLSERVQLRYDTLIADGEEEIAEAESEIADAEAEIADAETELADGKQEIEDGETELADAIAQLTDGEEQLADAKQQLADGEAELAERKAEAEAELADAKAELDEAQALLDEQEAELIDGEEQLAAAEAELAAQEKTLEESLAELDAAQEQLDASAAEYAASVAELTAQKEALATQKASLQESREQAEEAFAEVLAQMEVLETDSTVTDYTETYNTLLAQKAALEESLAQIEAALATVAAGEEQLAAAEEQLAAADEELAAAEAQIGVGREEAEAGQEQLTAAKAELAAQKETLESGRTQLEAAKETLAASWQEYEDGLTSYEEEIAAAEQELADARTQITESEAEIEDGWAEIEENQQKLADAKQEIEDGEAELTDAKQEVEDGKAEIENARQELADLEATQYLLGRDSNVGYVCFESDSMIVDNIANIFPFFFFLVAILICITTMNRMVEEGRTQIGVLKALGYSKSAIAGEYLLYSGSAALIGGLIGFAVGSTLFPSIIWYVYGIMYDAPGTRLVFSSGWLLFSILVALICSVGATLFSCYVEFASVPANLMRPRTPQSGKRVFMEYVTPVWKRLNFLQKVSVRNVLRYKKRFFMMVLGVSGCTALLLAANGMKDSVLHIADSQYDNIQTYDMEVTLSDSADEEQRTRLREDYAENIADMMFLYEDSVDLVTDDLTKEATLVVAQDPSQMEEFWHLYDSKGNAIDYPGEGEAVLTKKIANKLGVSVGDTLTVRTDDMKTYTVTVTGIAVNYVYNYMYISEDTYVQGYGTDPEYKMVCMKVAEGVNVYEASTVIVDDDDALQVTITEDVRTRLENMMDSLDAVVVLVITCAALLAFIVLYNLTNINIIERVREIATIKVLGFYPGETAQYVFRENLILTAIGAVIGLLLGKWLHAFIMVNIDVDIVSFELLIYPKSYILSIVLTFVFALLVDLVMYFKLQKIDMAESLKSIE